MKVFDSSASFNSAHFTVTCKGHYSVHKIYVARKLNFDFILRFFRLAYSKLTKTTVKKVDSTSAYHLLTCS